MPKYSGFDPIESHNVVTTGTSISGIDHSGDSTATAIYLPFDDNTNDATGAYTISGPASVSSAEAKFGGGSALFNTGTTHLTASGSQSAMAFTGAFTIEMWVYQTATPSGSGYTIAGVHNSTGWLWQLKPTYSRFWVNSSINARFEETLTNNTWHHLAVVREEAAGVVKFYLNGTLKATSGSTPSTMVSNRDLFIGAYRSGSSSQNFQGYIDDFRILDGVALYTSNFTPPASALGIHSIDPVLLYLPFDSDVNDDSSHGHTVTAYSDATISSTQAKFGGNSLALDGSNDYLSIADDDNLEFGNNDFTIEFWFWTSSNSIQSPICKRNNSWTNGDWVLYFNRQATGEVEFWNRDYNSSTPIINVIADSSGFGDSQWHHCSVTRAGNEFLFFLDGDLKQTVTSSHSFTNNSSPINIGRDYYTSGRYYFGGGSTGYIDDLRISKGVARYTKNFVPPSQAVGATLTGTNETNTTTDFTALYLPFDSDVNDDSPKSQTVTAYNGAAISSSQSKFGGYSVSFDGNNDHSNGQYLVVSDADSLEYGDKDFTLETWFYQNDDTGHMIAQRRQAGGVGTWSAGAWMLGVNTNYAVGNDVAGRIEFFAYDYNTSSVLLEYVKGSALSSGWHHLAVTRASDTFMLFLDGVMVDSNTGTFTFTNSSLPFSIGRDTFGNGATRGYMNGYLDDFRVLVGHAKYTSDFTPPTTAVGTSVSETVNDVTVLYMPFDGTETNISLSSSLTSLYLPFDSDLNDDGPGGYTTTAVGDATVSSTQSKFGGSSLYLDGSGDRLRVSEDVFNAIRLSDFTIEMFIYPTTVSNARLWSQYEGSNNRPLLIQTQSAGNVQLYVGAGSSAQSVTASSVISVNTWHHIAVVRNDQVATLFVDGVSAGSITFSGDLNTFDSDISIGARHSNASPFEGYIDDLRVVRYPIYTSNFTPPTSALGTTATTTVLKGGFEDQARNNTVTKNGDTTLNSSVKKFGTSSAYFDGTGDRVLVKHGGELNLSDGDFTIEGWFYFTSNVTARIFHGEEGSGTYSPWLFYTTSGGAIQFYASSNYSSWDVVSSASLGTVSLNTWTHLAVTRQGNTFRCFQDGVLKSTNTSSSSLYYNTDNQIAIGGRDGTNYMAGYADDLRIIKGKAIYTEAFTPPSSALGTQISETSSSSTTDTKSLSSTWTMTNDGSSPRTFIDMRSDNTWANNEHLQSQPGHRWNPENAPSGGGGGGTSVTFKAWGAGGGGGWWNGGSSGSGGSGGFAKGTLPAATPGTTYNVVVGPAGENAGSAVPSATGGNGAGTTNGSHRSGSGGGYSGVFDGPVTQGNALIIAGGGGGAGSYDRSGNDESGGGGGGTTGRDSRASTPARGRGGTQSYGYGGLAGGGPSTALQGGDGRNRFGMGAGGGGGGYYGGTGGGVDGSNGNEEIAGGGGGSGYVSPALSDTANLQGVTGTATSGPGQAGQVTAINPTASSDPDYTGTYGKGGGYNSDGAGGYVVITSPSGSSTFTSPGTYTVP